MSLGTSTEHRCIVCSGAMAEDSRLPGLVRCSTCRFVSADADLSDAELEALYGEDYFHGDEYADYVAESDELRGNFRKRLQVLTAVQDRPERGRLYEVGCAYGFFLDEARSQWTTVAGIDISEDAVRHARDVVGVDAVAGDYAQVTFDEPLDTVCMWDTVEHLAHPDVYIRKAAEDLRPGGILALTTGDMDSLNARLRGKRWRMIHPPTHLHYFSRRTLTDLLDRSGFDVVRVETAGNSRTLRGIAYAILVLRGKREPLYRRLTDRPWVDRLLGRSVTLDLRDIMFVVARKR